MGSREALYVANKGYSTHNSAEISMEMWLHAQSILSKNRDICMKTLNFKPYDSKETS